VKHVDAKGIERQGWLVIALLLAGIVIFTAGLFLMRVELGAPLIISGSILTATGALIWNLTYLISELYAWRVSMKMPTLITPSSPITPPQVSTEYAPPPAAQSPTVITPDPIISPVLERFEPVLTPETYAQVTSENSSSSVMRETNQLPPLVEPATPEPIPTNSNKTEAASVVRPVLPIIATVMASPLMRDDIPSREAPIGIKQSVDDTLELGSLVTSFDHMAAALSSADEAQIDSLQTNQQEYQGEANDQTSDMGQLISAALAGFEVTPPPHHERASQIIDEERYMIKAYKELDDENISSPIHPQERNTTTTHTSTHDGPSELPSADFDLDAMLARLALPQVAPAENDPADYVSVSIEQINIAHSDVQSPVGDFSVEQPLSHPVSQENQEHRPSDKSQDPLQDEQRNALINEPAAMTVETLIEAQFRGEEPTHDMRLSESATDLEIQINAALQPAAEPTYHQEQSLSDIQEAADNAHVVAEPESMLAEHAPEASEPIVVGRYTVGEHTYAMFSDGSIEANTSEGLYRFSSMDDLKAFIQQLSQGQILNDDAHPAPPASAHG
jgi:hypothetical protein